MVWVLPASIESNVFFRISCGEQLYEILFHLSTFWRVTPSTVDVLKPTAVVSQKHGLFSAVDAEQMTPKGHFSDEVKP